MTSLSTAVRQAAGALQQISESTAGARAERAATVALVLRTLEAEVSGAEGRDFLRSRAMAAVAQMDRGSERSLLKRLLVLGDAVAEQAGEDRLATGLVGYAYELELTRRLPEADAVMTLARCVAPESAEVALHAGRIARKQGDRERALSLYRAASALDETGGSLSRLAAVGAAVVSDRPERALSRALRAALREGDGEVAGVALEERARARRSAGARRAAARDLCVAAARFSDPVDRARVAHQLADLFVAADDPLAAREALLLVLDLGDGMQRDHARSRLHTVSRDLEDQVGMRRWRSFGRPALVSLSARPGAPAARSAAPLMARWREQVQRAAQGATA